MLRIQGQDRSVNCAGVSRRSFLQAGFLGLAGLSLADFLCLQEQAAAAGSPGKKTAVILIWLDGGPSQLETYDPKPEAVSEVRGPYGAVKTNVSGIRLSEMLPNHAKWAHRMAIIRSVHHGTGDHFAAAHWMLTGRLGSTANNKDQMFPSVGAYTAAVRGPNRPDLPAYVGLPAAESVYIFPGYQGAAYLGSAFNPFDADPDNRYIGASPGKKIGTPPVFTSKTDRPRLESRMGLLEKIDHVRAAADRSGALSSWDTYTQKAANLLLSPEVRKAFDLDAEPAKVAERYGDSPWCRYALLARRLVEAGVTFVTVDMPHWDDHSSIKTSIARKCLHFDHAVGALMQDLEERGMFDHVLVVAMGEFGRTPRLNQGLPNDPVPGRDHWGSAMSVMMAGGGLRMGQVIGATNENSEYPVDRPFTPADILATIYHVLGIDPTQTFYDRQGRPMPILSSGEPIRELI
jgi:hypothetical protein